MILQALKGYYDRLAGDSGNDSIPMLGFARQKIHFCLVLDREGNLVGENDLRIKEGNKTFIPELIVPEPVIRSGLTIRANFLWDNSGYVLGADNKEKPDRVVEKFQEFKKIQRTICEGLEDEGIIAVLRFLDKWKPEKAPDLPTWKEMAGLNLVFRLDGEAHFIHERQAVRDRWIKFNIGNSSESQGMCLITGTDGSIARLHRPIKGVPGSQTSGAALVSFNLDAFKSYGKDRNFNAPIGEDSAFAYCTALNWLLRRESRQKIQIGDAMIVFWTERKSVAENLFADLFDTDLGTAEDEAEDKSALRDLKAIVEAAREGRILDALEEPGVPFYLLALSPNASRLSVRFWQVSTVGEIVGNIASHFRQIEVVKSFASEPKYPSARTLLRETVSRNDSSKAWEKDKKVSPLLAGAFIRSVLTGEPYPQNLLPILLMRIRTDQTVNYLRAALIKACLVRNFSNREVSVSLDKENTNIGYRLGRLFALFERIQAEANPGINSTIRDKYFGSAAATPRNIFPMLVNLAQQHLGKLRRDTDKKGYALSYDAKIEEIVGALPAGALPAFLDPETQGLFAVGYYHQRQSFFQKKPEKKEEE